VAGYSGTPLARKLGIKAGHRVALVKPPTGFASELAELPADVALVAGLRGTKPFDVILYFVTRRRELLSEFARVAQHLTPAAGLWVCWPKKASGKATDLDGNVVRRAGLDGGLVDNKVCAVNEVWSGLRFVYRLKDRKT